MSPEQQAALRAQARAKEECTGPLAKRDIDELARILSIGRTRQSVREIGYGTIIETLGIAAGNKLIDHIAATDELRHVRPLLARGELSIGSPLAQEALQSFVALDVLSQADADELCSLGFEPAPLSPQDVASALFNPDGTPK